MILYIMCSNEMMRFVALFTVVFFFQFVFPVHDADNMRVPSPVTEQLDRLHERVYSVYIVYNCIVYIRAQYSDGYM